MLEPGLTFASITDKIAGVVLAARTPRGWWIGFAVAFAVTMLFLYSVTRLLVDGIGIWGVGVPVGWGFAIVNLVWWIGIGHAGTLISAILLLLRQTWRTSINRFAEAMTIFAVACAAVFPILHLGRPWLVYWILPYPNTMGVWPQFRSPLVWDTFAIGTYGLTSLLFWYVGLVPDLAALRDRATGRVARIAYGMLAMGWRGSARHWHRYEQTYLLLAGLATPLVVSVHTVVSLDFAFSIVPGWHSTVFPPYFVAGAIFSGFAMVLTLAIPLRAFYRLHEFVTDRHLDLMAKVLLATGLMVGYGYFMDAFVAYYGGNLYERSIMETRAAGPYAPAFWALLAANVLAVQFLWSARVRTNPIALFAIAIVVNVGMWLERFVIVVTSLHRDYLVSSWGMYRPTGWDVATYVGTIGLFFALFFLFIRFLPMISIAETKDLLEEERERRP